MLAKEARRELEDAAAAKERRLAALREREVEAKIQALLASPLQPVPYFGRKKVAWYT